MDKKTWLRNGLCLLAIAALLLCGAFALAEDDPEMPPSPELSYYTDNLYLPRGEFVTVVIYDVPDYWGFENLQYYAEVSGSPERYYWDEDERTIKIPTAQFEAGHQYMLQVTMTADGYWEQSSSTDTIIVTEPEAAITWDIEKTEAVSQERFGCSVYAPGAKALRVKVNNVVRAYWDDEDEYFRDYVVFSVFHDRPGTFQVIAEACFEGDVEDDSNWVQCDSPASVTITTPYGDMMTPSISAASSVVRGDFLSVDLLNPEDYIGPDAPDFEGLEFGVDAVISDAAGKKWSFEGFWDGESGHPMLVPTGNLPAGENYVLHSFAWANGYQVGEYTQPLTIEEPVSELDHPVYLTVDKEEVVANETYFMSAYAPGATAIVLYWRDDPNGEWIEDEGYYEETDSAYWENAADRRIERLEYALRACYGDPEDEDDWSELSDLTPLVVMSVEADGWLDDVPVELSANVLTAAEVNAGEGLQVTIEPVEGATWYYVTLNDHNIEVSPWGLDENKVFEDDIEPFEGTYTSIVPAERLTPGHIYDVWVCAGGALGLENTNCNYPFIVLPDVETSPFALYVNGSTEDQSAAANQKNSLYAVAPQGATGVCAFFGDDMRWSEGRYLDHTMNLYWPKDYPIVAMYTTDDIFDENGEPVDGWWDNCAWAGYSNIVTLTITASGELPDLQVSIPEGSTVDRGEWLEITIENAAELLATEAQDLRVEAAPFGRYDGRGFQSWYVWNGEVHDGVGTIMMPTADLPAGDYRLDAYAIAPGYTGGYCEPLFFTVTDPEIGEGEPPVYLELDKNNVETNEWFNLSAYAPGATQIQIVWNDNGDDEWRDWGDPVDGEGTAWNDRIDHPVHRTFALRACYGEDDWTDVFEEYAVTVTVRAPSGRLGTIRAELSAAVIEPDDELTLTVYPVDNAEEYWFEVNDNDIHEGNNCVFGRHVFPGEDGCTITIPTDELIPGHYYEVSLHARGGRGVETADDRYMFFVQPEEFTDNFTLYVNGGTESFEWPYGDNIDILVVAPEDATGVWVSAGDRIISQPGNRLHDYGTRLDNGFIYPVVAKYTTGDVILDEFGEPVDGWQDGLEWIGCSNIVVVTAVAENGDLPRPAFEALHDVTRGEFMTITITNADAFRNIEGLEIVAAPWARGDDGHGFDSWYGWNSETGVITMPTADLPEDSYLLNVWAHAPGYVESWGEEFIFNVTEPQAGEGEHDVVFTLNKHEVETLEFFAVSAYAPGANGVRVETEHRQWFRQGPGVAFEESFCNPDEMDFVVYANWGDLENDEDWEEFHPENAHLSVTAPEGKLIDVPLTYASSVAAGQDFTITAGNVPHAEFFNFEVRDNNIYDEDDFVFSGGAGTYTIPARLLTPGHAYYIMTHAEARGYDASDGRCGFIVLPEPENVRGDIALKIDGGTEAVQRLIGQRFTITVETGENVKATGVYIYEGTDWDHSEEGSYENDDWWMPDEGSYTFAAKYTTDVDIDPDSAWWETCEWAGYSNAVTVTVTSNGTMPDPVIGNLPETIQRGQWLEIPLTNILEYFSINGAYRVQGWFEDPETGEGWGWTDMTVDYGTNPPTATIKMSTAELWTGENGSKTYELHFLAFVDGRVGWHDSNEIVRNITVTEPNSAGDHPIFFSLSTDTAITGVDYGVSIYAPGAVQIHLQRQDDGNNWNWGDPYDPEGYCDSVFENWNETHQRETDYWVEALYVDAETGEQTWVECPDVRHLSVIAPNGKMDPVNVVLSASVLDSRDDLTITINPVQNAMEYWFEVTDEDYRTNEYGDIYQEEILNGWTNWAPRTYTIPADDLTPGHSYSVHACAVAFGYDNSDVFVGFVVRPDDADENITLTVNGSAEDMTVTVGQNMRVAVTAPANATGVYVVNAGVHEDMATGNTYDNDDNWYIDEAGVYTYLASYTTDPIDENEEWWKTCDWAGTSAPVKVTATSNGRLPMPQFSMQRTVTRGDEMVITIDNAAEYRGKAFSGSLNLVARAWDRQRDRWTSEYEWDSATGVIRLSTVDLEADTIYEVHVTADADGWEGTGFWSALEVTAPEENDHAIRFFADRTTVQTREHAYLSVYAPGADGLRLYRDGMLEDWWDDDYVIYDASENWACAHAYTVAARFDGEWVFADNTITITVTSAGPLPTVTIDGPDSIEAGEDYVFSVVNQNGQPIEFDGIDVNVWRQSDWQPIWQGYAHENTIAVPAFNDWGDGDSSVYHGQARIGDDILLASGEMYSLRVTVNLTGRDSVEFQKYFTVGDYYNEENGFTLTVNGENAQATAQVNEPVRVVVNAPQNATAIRLYAKDDEEWGDGIRRGNQLDDYYSWGSADAVPVYARYTTDTLTGEDWEIDWNSVSWSNTTSNVVYLTLTNSGAVAYPEFTVTPRTVTRGELVTVTITNYTEGHSYRAEFDQPGVRRWNGTDFRDGDTAILHTENLEPGEYRVLVGDNGALGLTGRESYMPITVVEQAQPVFTLSSHNLMNRQSFTVSMYAPGATALKAVIDGDEDHPWYDYETDNFMASDWRFDDPGEHTITPMWRDANNNWHSLEGETINVTAPNGLIDVPNISFPNGRVITLGQDMIVDLGRNDFDYVHAWARREGQDFYDNSNFDNYRNGIVNPRFVIPASVLDVAGNYSIWFNLYGVGYLDNSIEISFIVTDGQTSGLTLEIDGGTADVTKLVNQEFTVSVTGAPANATAIALYTGNDWQYFPGSTFEEVMSQTDVANRCWYAKYTEDVLPENFVRYDHRGQELTWSGISNMIAVTTTANGTLPQPTFTLDKNTFVRGEMIAVHLSNCVDGANYSADIHTEGEWDWFGRRWGVGTIYMPTVDIPAGDYEMHVNADGVVGMKGSFSTINISVVDGELEPFFMVEKTEVETGEGFRYFIYAPGADAVRFCYESIDNPWQEEEGDHLDSGAGCHNPKDWTFLAAATYDGGVTWVEIDRITISVSASHGPIAVAIGAPNVLFAGDDLTLSIDTAKGQWGIVEIHDIADQGRCVYEYDDAPVNTPIMVPANTFVAGREYEIYVYASPFGQEGGSEPGWYENRVTKELRVVDINDLSTLTLPAALSEIGEEAFEGIAAERVIIPNGITTIAPRAFANCDNLIIVEIPDSVTTIDSTAFDGSDRIIFVCSDTSKAAEFAEAHDITHLN